MLRQVLGELDLTVYPEVSLVIFFLVFGAIIWSVWTLNSHLDVKAASRMPLDDDPHTSPLDQSEETR